MDQPTKPAETTAAPAALPQVPLPTYNDAVHRDAVVATSPNDLAPTQQKVPDPTQVATVTPLDQLTQASQSIDCPFCQRRTTVEVNTEGTAVQLVAGVLCCLCCICLACVPCLAGWCEDQHFSCSDCKKRVATRFHDGVQVQVYGPVQAVPSEYQPAQPMQAKYN